MTWLRAGPSFTTPNTLLIKSITDRKGECHVTDPMHEMSEARKKLNEREARIRKLREGLMPWTRHIPWIVLGFAPRVLYVIGVIAAVAGLSAWAMAFPVAAIALQLAADMPRRRRSHRAMDRIASASTVLVVLGVGVVLVVVNGTWLADQTILWPMLEVIGWTVVSVGVWGLTNSLVILLSLIVSPVTPEEVAFSRTVVINLTPDATAALRSIVGDELKQGKDEVMSEAVTFYADHFAGREGLG
jgi:hypothetical protein